MTLEEMKEALYRDRGNLNGIAAILFPKRNLSELKKSKPKKPSALKNRSRKSTLKSPNSLSASISSETKGSEPKNFDVSNKTENNKTKELIETDTAYIPDSALSSPDGDGTHESHSEETKTFKPEFSEKVEAIYRAYPRKKKPRMAKKAIEAAIQRIRSGNDRPDWHEGNWPRTMPPHGF